MAHRQRRAVKEAPFTVAAVVLFILARGIHAQVRQRLLSCATSGMVQKGGLKDRLQHSLYIRLPRGPKFSDFRPAAVDA